MTPKVFELIRPDDRREAEVILLSYNLSELVPQLRTATYMFAEMNGDHKSIAVMFSTCAIIVHGFTVTGSAPARLAVDKLVCFALGFGNGIKEREVAFVVDDGNERMKKYVEGLGAIPDGKPASLYSLRLK
jgi:hypothetical protein